MQGLAMHVDRSAMHGSTVHRLPVHGLAMHGLVMHELAVHGLAIHGLVVHGLAMHACTYLCTYVCLVAIVQGQGRGLTSGLSTHSGRCNGFVCTSRILHHSRMQDCIALINSRKPTSNVTNIIIVGFIIYLWCAIDCVVFVVSVAFEV